MSIIKNIGNLPPEFRRTDRNEKQSQIQRQGDTKARAPAAASAEKVPANTTDQVHLSDTAKTLLQRDAEVNRFTAQLPNVETLSSDERRDIDFKIEAGFYNTPEVTETVAGKIAEDVDSAKKSLTPARMQDVIEKIRANEYDSASVLDTIADKIIRDL